MTFFEYIQKSPLVTFFVGLAVLVLFGWYFLAEEGRRKRLVGSALTLVLLAFCLLSVWPPKEKIRLGLDLKGGTAFLIQLVRETGDKLISRDAQDQAVEVIRSRVDRFGVGEPVITPVGTDQILVQIPGLEASKIADAREQVQRVAKLEFRLVNARSDQLVPGIEQGQTIIPPGYQLMNEERTERPANGAPAAPRNTLSRANPLLNNPVKPEGPKVIEKLLVKSRPDMTGDHVTKAFPFFDQQGYGVSLELDAKGKKEFADLTSQHVGERLAIVLDNKIVTAPVLRQPIYEGRAQITGNMDDTEARNLSSALENPLQTPVRILEQRSVSATLGGDSIRSGIISGLAGLALTSLFVLFYYRLAGLFAWVALVVNVILLFGVMSMFNFVLTLPGIAGMILTIATAIDANVLVYERLREELAAGKNLRAALDGAFRKALSSIVDANVTTLITSVMLFWQASGPVKGFAVTLTVGIIASLFAALIVTRNLFGWAVERGGLTRVRMMNLVPRRQFDFMGSARTCVIGSAVVILFCAGAFAVRGQKNFGIDFRGGDLLVLASKQPLAADQVRGALPADLKESVVQIERRESEQLVEIRSASGSSPKVEQVLRDAFPTAALEKRQEEHVGGLVGKQLAYHSLLAFGLGLAGILIYLSIRFEFSFALGAIVALFHDVIITVGVFALTGRELSLVMVGAVLTIAGYSINDTIVVYDRIRSGLREGRRGSVREIMNASINETLGRTILTAGATFITVAALFIGGGPVLHDFALAMLVGVIVGTYSSIFVASPIVLWTSRRRDLRKDVRPSYAPVTSPADAHTSPAKV